METLKYWFRGVRIYLATAIVLMTGEVWWWAHVMYGGSNLVTIRIQEAYAWLAVALLLLAVFIGPVVKIFPEISAAGKGMLRDSRRLLGIGAAWFGLLHAGITYFALFRAVNPLTLAGSYQRAFLLGIAALVILLLMAFTSFDRAFRRMGTWWFRLHRLVYIAVLITVLHAFMIGTHATDSIVLLVVGAAAAVLLGMHMFIAIKYGKLTKLQVVTIAYAVVLTLAVLNYGITKNTGYNLILQEREDATHGGH